MESFCKKKKDITKIRNCRRVRYVQPEFNANTIS